MRILICFLLPVLLFGTERTCWYERDLQPIIGGTYLIEEFSRIESTKRSTIAHFFTLSVLGSYDDYAIEFETTAACGTHRSFGLDGMKLTGRIRWLNDIVGDSVSLVTGLTASYATHQARHDLAAFHHGGIDGEGFVTVGREWSKGAIWYRRLWGVAAVGGGDLGSPWIRAQIHYEKNFCFGKEGELFAESLVGFGKRRFDLQKFYSWGPIAHRSLDIGGKFSWRTDFCGIFSCGYTRRIWAQNYPEQANIGWLKWEYFFGI